MFRLESGKHALAMAISRNQQSAMAILNLVQESVGLPQGGHLYPYQWYEVHEQGLCWLHYAQAVGRHQRKSAQCHRQDSANQQPSLFSHTLYISASDNNNDVDLSMIRHGGGRRTNILQACNNFVLGYARQQTYLDSLPF